MNDINDECVEYTLCCLVSTRWSSSLWSEGLVVSGLPWDPCCLSPSLAGWHPPHTWCTGCNSLSSCLRKPDVNCLMIFSSPDRQFPFPILHQVLPLTWTTITQQLFDLLTKHLLWMEKTLLLEKRHPYPMVSVEIGKLDQSCFDIYTRWYQGLYLEALVSQHMLCHVLVLLWGSQPGEILQII